MKAIRQFLKVPSNREIKIKLPEDISVDKTIEVILIIPENKQSFEKKVAMLKETVKDKIFHEDLREIEEDFRRVDLEEWR